MLTTHRYVSEIADSSGSKKRKKKKLPSRSVQSSWDSPSQLQAGRWSSACWCLVACLQVDGGIRSSVAYSMIIEAFFLDTGSCVRACVMKFNSEFLFEYLNTTPLFYSSFWILLLLLHFVGATTCNVNFFKLGSSLRCCRSSSIGV